MKKISKKREKEIETMIKLSEDEDLWDNRKLGNNPKFTKAAAEEFKKSSMSVGTSIRMPLKLIKDLKKIAEEEGIPYQTLVKSILTKYVRDREKTA